MTEPGSTVAPVHESDCRDYLIEDRDYFVDAASGRNSNSGRHPADAFQSIQFASWFVQTKLDLGNRIVRIRIAPGTYREAVHVKENWHGAGKVFYVGDRSDNRAVVVDSPGIAFSADRNVTMRIFDLTIKAASHGVYSWEHSRVFFQRLNFASCGDSHIHASRFGYVEAVHDYDISGSARAHIDVQDHSYFRIWGGQGRVVENVAFDVFASATRLSIVSLMRDGGYSVLPPKSVEGLRYRATRHSVINAFNGGGVTVFPGSAGGIVDATSLYES